MTTDDAASTTGGAGDLTEPQGVNAGSGAREEDAEAPSSDISALTEGGRPQDAPEPGEAADPPEKLLGLPDQDAPGPGQELSVGEG